MQEFFPRLRVRQLVPPVAAGCLALAIVACAETKIALHAAKQLGPTHEETIVGTYKVGNPYQINGVWYYPAVDYDYVETGIASWYGPGFHKKVTANGQIFDMNEITAAHRTLPLPSIVRVTNLENGRSLQVLVNDRGPFARGRIIDVSRRTAQLLGFEHQGTARVRVEILSEESRRLALIAQGHKPPASDAIPRPVTVVAVAEEPVAPAPAVARVSTVPLVEGTRLFVQAGAFTRREFADRTRDALDPIGPARVVEAMIDNRIFYRVRLGPLETVSDGDRLLDQVVASGYPDARLIVD